MEGVPRRLDIADEGARRARGGAADDYFVLKFNSEKLDCVTLVSVAFAIYLSSF